MSFTCYSLYKPGHIITRGSYSIHDTLLHNKNKYQQSVNYILRGILSVLLIEIMERFGNRLIRPVPLDYGVPVCLSGSLSLFAVRVLVPHLDASLCLIIISHRLVQ